MPAMHFDDTHSQSITLLLDVTPRDYLSRLVPVEMRKPGSPYFSATDYAAAEEAIREIAPLHGLTTSLDCSNFEIIVRVGCPLDLQPGHEAVEAYRTKIARAVEDRIARGRRNGGGVRTPAATDQTGPVPA